MEILETERLLLRSWQHDDLDALYKCAQNPDIGIMTGWEPHSSKELSLKVLKCYIDSDENWAIVLKESGRVIGQIGISSDENRGKYYAKYINYMLSSDYWNKGYMTEAVKRVTKYLFEVMNIDLLTIFFFPHNVRSKRVAEKCAFKYETTIKQARKIYDGQVFDTVVYSMFKSDYLNMIENK